MLVLVAVVLEIGWVVLLPFAEGFTRPGPLAGAVRTLPIGTAYAAWTGMGAAGAGILGWLVHAEPLTSLRVLGILLVIAGVAGLRLLERPEAAR